MSKILFLSLLMFTMDESHKIKCYFLTIRYYIYKEMFDDVLVCIFCVFFKMHFLKNEDQ